MAQISIARWWQSLDRPGWRSFALAMLALGVALLLALSSVAAVELGRTWLAGGMAVAALLISGWVAVTIVPVLARRTRLGRLSFRVEYKLTRQGMVYMLVVLVILLAALNTGNNLLFMILASLLAGILISGVLSRTSLTGAELRFELPEHVFAAQPVTAVVELRNAKKLLPSFSLRVTGTEKEDHRRIFTRPVYFPYVAAQQSARQTVELVFPRRGVYRQEGFGVSTRFPFGFLQKTRRMAASREIVVYPPVEPTEEFYEVLPLISGEMESFHRGRGHDLYAIREYQTSDSARFVDWKASARTGSLKVREFTREDERRVMLALDPFLPAAEAADAELREKFERAVKLCAGLAWHFYEIDSEVAFRTAGAEAPMAPASEVIYDILRELALVEARPTRDNRFLMELAEVPDVFKLVLTAQPRGTIPTGLWSSSYFVFVQSL